MSARPIVLVIAGSDSSGGAGLTRDVRAAADFGAETLCAVTAVTAQSDRRVAAVHPIPPAVVRAQIEAAIETCEPDAVKIGMLVNRGTVEAVAAALASVLPRSVPIVLDPVLVATSGGVLLDEGGRRALREQLLSRVALLTPNLPEAAILLDEAQAVDGHASAPEKGALAAGAAMLDGLARRLLDLGPGAVLLKGGHASETEAIDRLARRGERLQRLASPRFRATRRGTGCALASAIAAQLAAGVALEEACRRAKDYLSESLQAAGR